MHAFPLLCFVSALCLVFFLFFFDLYCVYVCFFVIYIRYFPYCLFVSNSQVIGCEDRPRNDLLCVEWDVKLYTLTPSAMFLIDCQECRIVGCITGFFVLIGQLHFFHLTALNDAVHCATVTSDW